jgi:phosphoglycolate phosphatase
MATLLLRGQPIGSIHGVLFDKDGTLSHSEPHLLDLFERRLAVICDLWRDAKGAAHLSELDTTLRQAFGIRDKALHPGGTLAVAARQDNLTSTATVFCIFGCSWPEALALAETCFQRIDQQFSDDGSSRPLLDGAKRFLEKLDNASVLSAVISNDTTKGNQYISRSRKHQLSGGGLLECG